MKSLNVVGAVKFPEPVSSDNAALNRSSNILQETVLFIVCTLYSASLPMMLHIRNSLLADTTELNSTSRKKVRFSL